MTNDDDKDAVLKEKITRFRELAKWAEDRGDQFEADAQNKLADELERILQGCDADLLRIIARGDDTSIGLRHPSHAKRWMGDPLFLNSPAIRRARKRRAVVSLEGAHSLRDSKHGLSPAMAAITAVICAAVTCIWGYIFTSPNMPGIDPAIEYAWFIPVIPLFNMVWLASTLGLICAFYLVLRAPVSNPARGLALAAFLVQYLLGAAWTWAFFIQRRPYGSFLLMGLFVLAAGVTVILAARADRRAALFMAPYITWISFVLLVTASKAINAGYSLT